MSMHIVKDSSSPGDIQKADDQEKDRERDLEFILSKPRGRRWVHDIIYSTSHVDLNSHIPGCSDSTAFNEGARSIGAKILEDIRAAHPEHYLKMLEENHFDG